MAAHEALAPLHWDAEEFDFGVVSEDEEPKTNGEDLRLLFQEELESDNDDDYCCDDVTMLWQHLFVAADIYDLRKLKLVCEQNLCEFIGAKPR